MLRDHLVNAEMLREEIDSLLSLGIFFSVFRSRWPESDQKVAFYQAEELRNLNFKFKI